LDVCGLFKKGLHFALLLEEEEEEEASDITPPHSERRDPEERAGVGKMWERKSRTGEGRRNRTNPTLFPSSLFELFVRRSQWGLARLLGEVKTAFFSGFTGVPSEERKGRKQEKGDRRRRRERRRKRKRTGK
jgi:hypothetical protein